MELPEPPKIVLAKYEGHTLIQWWIRQKKQPEIWVSEDGAIAELHNLEVVYHPLNDPEAPALRTKLQALKDGDDNQERKWRHTLAAAPKPAKHVKRKETP